MDSNRSTEITRSKNTVVRARAGGVSTTPKFLAANFAKQNTDFGGGEREGGAGIPFPLAPFPARPARALGGGWVCRACGAALGRIFVKISSNFVQKVPPFFKIGVLERGCLALATLGLGRNEDLKGIFEVKEKGALGQAEVRYAKHGQNEILQTNLFSLAFGERQSGNLMTAQKRL